MKPNQGMTSCANSVRLLLGPGLPTERGTRADAGPGDPIWWLVTNPAAARGSRMVSAGSARRRAVAMTASAAAGHAFADSPAEFAQVLLENGVGDCAVTPRFGARGTCSLREDRAAARQPLLGVDDEPQIHRGRERLEAHEQIVLGLGGRRACRAAGRCAVCGCVGAPAGAVDAVVGQPGADVERGRQCSPPEPPWFGEPLHPGRSSTADRGRRGPRPADR